MNKKQLKKLVAGAVMGTMMFGATPAFAYEMGGVALEGNWTAESKDIEPRAAKYRSLLHNSFEDGTWNILVLDDIRENSKISFEFPEYPEYSKFTDYLQDIHNSKFVEVGMQDLPLDLGPWILHDVKELSRTSGGDVDCVDYAVQYTPKVGNGTYKGEVVCKSYIGGFGDTVSPRVRQGFFGDFEKNVQNLTGKVLESPDSSNGMTGFQPIVGEKIWTSVVVDVPKHDESIYLFITDIDAHAENSSYNYMRSLGAARSDIVGVRLHLEDKSYRNFDNLELSSVPDSKVALSVDGEVVSNSESAPFIHNGTTMVPLRLASEAVGATVSYKDAVNQLGNNIVLQKDSDKVDLFTKSTLMAKNEEKITKLTTAPVIIEGSSYVPVRAIAEALGCRVSYNSEGRTVVIES